MRDVGSAFFPDLVLTDLDMPRMTGEDLIRRLQVTHPDLKVAVITASLSDEVRLNARAMGVRGYFTKPFDLDEFFDRVAELLGLDYSSPSPKGPGHNRPGPLGNVVGCARMIAVAILGG